MQTIRLNVDALKVKSFATTENDPARAVLFVTALCTTIGSAVSETDGVAWCKSCGPCCA